MNNKDVLKIAMNQSAMDNSCTIQDFLKNENVIVYSKDNERARNYLVLPHYCNLISYGNNVVATIDKSIEKEVEKYLDSYATGQSYRCFETPQINKLNDVFKDKGVSVCFMAEYFLPDVNSIKALDCGYDIKLLDADELSNLSNDIWENALSSDKRRHLDMLGVGAYDGENLIGLAACSADCDTMWQIGVDVMPEYWNKNIGSAVTSSLACEVLKRDIVPFYCCAWSNIKSVRNAIKSGFRPAWVEMTMKTNKFIEEMSN